VTRRAPWWLAAAVIASLLAPPPPARADVPQLIAYQGRLTEDNGQPLIGEHTINFRLYDAEQGGARLWEEGHRLALASRDNGVFSVVLGSLQPFGAGSFTKPLWMGLEVDRDGEMTPRLRLTASGYAINADTLDGMDSRQFLRADTGTVAQGQLVLTNPGRALLIHPATPVNPDLTLLEVQHPTGQSRFIVEADGDVTIDGDLTVRGALRGGAAGAGSGAGAGATAAAIRLSNGAGLVAEAAGLSLLRGCADGQVLKWRASASAWECSVDATQAAGGTGTGAGGAISEIAAGTGLTGGGATGAVTLNVGVGQGLVAGPDAIAADVGTTAHKLVQLDGDGGLPAVSGARLTQLNAANLASGTIAEARLPDSISRLGVMIDSAEIADGAIALADLAIDSVGAAALRTDAIQAGDIELTDLPAHAARHAPGGPDALAIEAAGAVGAANAAGSAASFARADHVHQGVHAVRVAGQPALAGDVTLAAGDNVTLNQQGQTITIQAGGGAGGGTTGKASIAASTPVTLASGADTELLSVNVTKSQAASSLMIIATVQLSHTSGNNKSVDLKLFRGATQLDGSWSARVGNGGSAVELIPITVQAWDVAGAGAHTIRLMARASGDGVQAGLRRLTVVELF
jgi:hypothetical protein